MLPGGFATAQPGGSSLWAPAARSGGASSTRSHKSKARPSLLGSPCRGGTCGGLNPQLGKLPGPTDSLGPGQGGLCLRAPSPLRGASRTQKQREGPKRCHGRRCPVGVCAASGSPGATCSDPRCPRGPGDPRARQLQPCSRSPLLGVPRSNPDPRGPAGERPDQAEPQDPAPSAGRGEGTQEPDCAALYRPAAAGSVVGPGRPGTRSALD